MSEYCILGDNDGEINGHGKDLGMNPALYMARVIHTDLAVAQASAWHWWLAISPYNYKDGLIYISKSETDGEIEESKMLWALGNYSRFIRPGYHRVSAILNDRESQNRDLLPSAYQDPNSGNIVIVVVNSSNQEATVNVETDGETPSESWDVYLTDSEHNLAHREMPSGDAIRIPARSVMTLTSNKP